MNAQDFLMNFDSLTGELTEKVSTQLGALEAAWAQSRPLAIAIDQDNTELQGRNHQMDLALLQVAQVAVVPKFNPFHPLQENGHRFLLAADGFYLEVRRPWLYFVHCLAQQTAVAMPYGEIKPVTELAFGRIGNALGLIQGFARKAIDHVPNESATMIAWDENEQALVELDVEATATSTSVKYTLPDLPDHQSLAIDLHSHGTLPAFFSGDDNQDDAGSVKIAGVLGNLAAGDTPTALFRLCVLGLYLPIPVPADRIFA